MIQFRCNLCGPDKSIGRPAIKHRERLNCVGCQTTARVRGVVYAIQRELLRSERGTVLRSATQRKEITGIGFSDSHIYAAELDRIFDYTNTFYHKDPMLDIMSGDSIVNYRPTDFVVCSDVLEHVAPPAIIAFHNLRKLVRPGGVLILIVPYLEGYETIEHYPHLYKWKTVELVDRF